MNTVQSYWESFKSNVIPDDASEVQLIEMQKSFYAGAASLHKIMSDAAGSNMSEDAGAALVGSLEQEMRDFSTSLVIAGD